jgi:UDP-N-acetylglucosamine:LPS N-acetylglucosamine transferase
VISWCGEPPLVVDGLLDSARRPVPYPMLRYLRAFDVAVISAGYNSAHECASVGLPAVLYARPRAFDDQHARALRFEAAGLGVYVDDPARVGSALDLVGGSA